MDLVSQLKQMLKNCNLQNFLKVCNGLTASTSCPEAIPLISSEYLEDIGDAETQQIFSRLSFLWTWNDHSILRALLEGCNCQDGIKMLDDFESQIDTNQPMELFPIPAPSMKMAPSLSSGYTVQSIRVEYDRDELVTLQYVNDITTIMIEKFSVSSHALQLLAGRISPLVLYFVILKSIVPLIHKGINEHLDFFKGSEFTEIIIYPSTILYATDNLNLGPYVMLQPMEVSEHI